MSSEDFSTGKLVPGLPGTTKSLDVKNKTPAPIQISAEHLLREALERQGEEVKRQRTRFVDEEELQEYKTAKRKEFEDRLRMHRHHLGLWIQYADWEAGQKEFLRARSVFERALNVDFQNTILWQHYLDMETKNKFVNSARNLYDRVCQLLPRNDQFWFKYAHMEELLGNYVGARQVFNRWMEWCPDGQAWIMFVNFEERCGEIQLARQAMERYVATVPCQVSFLKFAKFEEKHKSAPRARAAFEKAVEVLGTTAVDEDFYLAFAEFETRERNYERASAIYQEGIRVLPKDQREKLYPRFLSYQKMHGSRQELEDAVLEKRRLYYNTEIKDTPHNYDTWFDFIRLEEGAGDADRIRAVYERAVTFKPPLLDKRYWKRYVYIWLNFAVFEELTMGDIDRAREVYHRTVAAIPAKKFTFAKLWKQFAEFEIRQMDLARARKVYGTAIGLCGQIKPKVYFQYADMELHMANFERARTILAKLLEAHPLNPEAWLAFVDLELNAEELERVRYLFDVATELDAMANVDSIWSRYIEFELENGELDKVADLYRRFLKKFDSPQWWFAFVDFELDQRKDLEAARKVVQQAADHYKFQGHDEQRARVMEKWLLVERIAGTEDDIERVWRLQPKKVKRTRTVVNAQGEPAGSEQFTAYIFPGDEGPEAGQNLKILEIARQWRAQKQAA